ncbi:hypothetical protein CBR_g39933 [Chara braunii]|uniref:Uncharacterized protein n=1 Tax=Chara braunii TaxID=69332 RepID=A0A388K1M1_CHABU|nr:hypothetical protein CBR_g39933 [Chara braunii]|eukprot:GBG63929.1 hypothetical protein CBR_g39933 [Chara braunii]
MHRRGGSGGGGMLRATTSSSSAQWGSRARLSTVRRSYFLAGVLKDGYDGDGSEFWDGYGRRGAVDMGGEEEEEDEDRLPFSERLDTLAGIDAVGSRVAGFTGNVKPVPPLTKLCIDAVCRSSLWERQRGTIELLPEELANQLFYRLAQEGKILDKHLELFQKCVGEVDLSCCGRLDATWLAYLGGFRFLRTLSLSGCSRVQGSSLWTLSALTRLESLDLSHCPRVGDDAIPHLLALQNLDSLSLAETSVSGSGAMQLAGLRNLVRLDLGGIHSVSDSTIFSLQDLTDLEDMELWGSSVTDAGAAMLTSFSLLRTLNLAWTHVETVPPLYNLRSLNLSECKLHSVFAGWEPELARESLDSLYKGDGYGRAIESGIHRAGNAYAARAGEMQFYSRQSRPRIAPLRILHLAGATFLRKESIVLGSPGLADVEELSITRTEMSLDFLAGLRNLVHVDMTQARDRTGKAFDMMALAAKNMVELNLSGFRNNSITLHALAGHVPCLERISLSNSPADWSVFMYLQYMPNLRIVDLSNTNLYDHTASGSIELLENLHFLHTLILWGAKLHDYQFSKIRVLRGLRRLEVTLPGDELLPALSNLSRLTHLGLFFSAVTIAGLEVLTAQRELQELDVTGCQRLQKQDLVKFSRKMPGLVVRARETHMNNLTGNDGPIGVLRWERWQELEKRRMRRASLGGESPTTEEITRGWMGSNGRRSKGGLCHSLADVLGNPLYGWCLRNGEFLTADDRMVSLDMKADVQVKGGDATSSASRYHGADERICYSQKFLLELRNAPLSNRPLSALGVAQIPNITVGSVPSKNPAGVIRTGSLSPPRSSSHPCALPGLDAPCAPGSFAPFPASSSISIPSHHSGHSNQPYYPSSYQSSALLSLTPPARSPPILGHISPAAMPSASPMPRYVFPTTIPVPTGSVPLGSSGGAAHLPPWCTQARK